MGRVASLHGDVPIKKKNQALICAHTVVIRRIERLWHPIAENTLGDAGLDTDEIDHRIAQIFAGPNGRVPLNPDAGPAAGERGAVWVVWVVWAAWSPGLRGDTWLVCG